MDAYTKAIFTIIAGALVVIAFNMTIRPDPATAFLGDGPTFGDWMDLAKNRNSPEYRANLDNLVRRAPLVVPCEHTLWCGRPRPG